MDHRLPLALATPLVWVATIAPGYVVLRTRFDRSTATLLSFPTSVVLLHTCVLALQLLTGAISGPAVVVMLTLIFAAALASSSRRTVRLWPALRADTAAAADLVRRRLRNADGPSLALAGMVLALIVVVSVDFCIDPLRRMDNTFRWGNLAERLFALRTLDFYPPRSAADFSSYFLPDGIAPELSIAFWWCFTLGGSPAPANALGFIQLEALWLILLIAALARDVGGPASYRRGVALACGAAIPFGAISCGCESGLLAIGTVGALHALLQLSRRQDGTDDSRWSYAAIACASVAALAREYGPVTLAMTLVVLVIRKRPGRELATAGALALILAGSWYLRTWVRSGNPFYIHQVGGIFPGIPVFTHYLRFAYLQSTVLAMSPSQLVRMVFWLIYGAPVAWLLGGAVAVRRPRHITVVFAAVWTFVYLWATSYSAGGYGFALRVASPTISILTALAASVPWRSTPLRRGLVGAAITLLFVKTATDLLVGGGGRIWRAPLRELTRPAQRFPWPVDDRIAFEIRRRGGRVLSSNGHLTPVMRAFAIDLVPIWSPEVQFLFDPAVSAGELRSRLRALGLRVYDPVHWEEYVSGDRALTLTEAFATWRPLPVAEPAQAGTEQTVFMEDPDVI